MNRCANTSKNFSGWCGLRMYTKNVTKNKDLKKCANCYILSVQEEKAMAAAPQGPIDASKFIQYVQDRKKKRILFKGEYLVRCDRRM